VIACAVTGRHLSPCNGTHIDNDIGGNRAKSINGMNNDNASLRHRVKTCGIIKVIAIREDESVMGQPRTIISF